MNEDKSIMIDSKWWKLQDVYQRLESPTEPVMDSEVESRVEKCHKYLLDKLPQKVILFTVSIQDLALLQKLG